MRRLWLGVSLVAALFVVPAAQAGAPIIVPAPAVDFTDTTCGFPIAVHFTANGETAKIFSNGTIVITGPLAATFSANGKTVSLNISGPATIYPDGTAVGHGVGAGATTLPNGQVILAYTAGVANITTFPSTVLHGHVLINLCEALAP